MVNSVRQEDTLLISRYSDSVLRCRVHHPAFFGFLDERERAVLETIPLAANVAVLFWGGFDTAERTMAGIFDLSDFASDPNEMLVRKKRQSRFPLANLAINVRCRDEQPTHRDYLGAIMGLGIKRTAVGDIVCSQYGAEVWCDEKIASFIKENLTSVGKYTAMCEIAAKNEPKRTKIDTEEGLEVDLSGQECYNDTHTDELSEMIVTSERLDAVLSALLHISREKAVQLITGKQVRHNSLETTDKDKLLATDDVFSVTGYGKYRVRAIETRGKKNKRHVFIWKYR